MAIDYYLDLYPSDDPRDGTRLVRYTASEHLQAVDYRDVVGVGSGQAILSARLADAAFLDPEGEQYFRIVRDDGSTELVVGGFWSNRVRYEAAVAAETRRIEVGGAGTLAYCARAVRAPHTYIDQFPGVDHGNDPTFEGSGLWGQGAPIASGDFLGAALWRLVWEAQHFRIGTTPYTHRHADGIIYTDIHDDDRLRSAIPDLVLTFDGFEDTDGNPWTIPSGNFRAAPGENLLSSIQLAMQSGLYVEMDPDTFELRAWEGTDHRRDRTGGAWGAAVVRLQAPTDGTIATGNIKSDSERLITSHIKRRTIWTGGGDNVYGFADAASGTPWEGFVSSNVADVDALDNLAETQLTAREEAGDVLTARLKLGAVPSSGKYLPWEHVKLDDLVTVHTGTGEWDYNEATYPVAALRLHLREAGDWDAWVDLGASFEAMADRQFVVPATPAQQGLLLCDPTTEGTPDTELYHLHWNGATQETVAIVGGGTAPWPASAGRVESGAGSDGASGYIGFKLSDTGDGSPELPATAGAEYRFEFDTRYGGGIDIEFKNGTSGLSSTRMSTHLEGMAWVPRTFTITAPATTDRMIFKPIGAGHYDHVRIYEVNGAEGANPYAGTSGRAARCDHTHPEGEHDHDADYAPLGHSHLFDDLADVDMATTPPVDGDVPTYDATAEMWVPAAPTGGGGTIIVEEEDGTPTAAFDTIKFPNGSVTDNGDGSASVDLAVVGGALSAALVGNTGGPGALLDSTGNRIWIVKVSFPSAGLLASIDAYIEGNGSNIRGVIAGVYDDNAGSARNVIAAAEAGTATTIGLFLNTTPRWVSIPINFWVPAAGDYWLAWKFQGGGGTLSIHYTASGTGHVIGSTGAWLADASLGTASTVASRTWDLRGRFIT